MGDFWEDHQFYTYTASALDEHLAKNQKASVRSVVLGKQLIPENVASGTRVAFEGGLSSLLFYENPPSAGDQGTVVMVRTAAGDTTTYEGLVFVKWDDGRFFGSPREHLTLASTVSRRAFSYRRTVASLGDLDDFLKSAGSDTDLIHKATKDLWSLKSVDGNFVIERLFDESGKPLKV